MMTPKLYKHSVQNFFILVCLLFSQVGYSAVCSTRDIGVGFTQRQISNQNYQSEIDIMLGNGDASFQMAQTIVPDENPISLLTADFNNDGYQDIIYILENTHTVSVYFGNMNGIETTPVNTDFLFRPAKLSVADVNNDHVMDLILEESPRQYINIAQGNGDGHFEFIGQYRTGSVQYSELKIIDMNGDGFNDIYTSGRKNPEIATESSTLFGTSNGNFMPAVTFNINGDTRDIEITDINKDGIVDLLVSRNECYNIELLKGQGDGRYISLEAEDLLSTYKAPAMTLSDVNSDGDEDIIISSYSVPDLELFLNDGNGHFMAGKLYPVGDHSLLGTDIDVNNDGYMDIVVKDKNNNALLLLAGSADGLLTMNPLNILLPDGAWPRKFSDANGDGLLDIILRLTDSKAIAISPNQTGVDFSEIVLTAMDDSSYAWHYTDINNDGILDVIVHRRWVVDTAYTTIVVPIVSPDTPGQQIGGNLPFPIADTSASLLPSDTLQDQTLFAENTDNNSSSSSSPISRNNRSFTPSSNMSGSGAVDYSILILLLSFLMVKFTRRQFSQEHCSLK